MSDYSRIRRQQLLRAAEGYLELAVPPNDHIALGTASRDRLAQHALDVLGRLEPASGHRAHAAYLAGQAFRTMERYEDAITPLKESAKLDGENVHVWLALGWCYKRTNRLDLAIQALEEALGVNSEEAIIHYNLACYWSLVGNVKLAVKYLSQSFDLQPSYRDMVAKEADFNPIRNHPYFQALTTVIV